MQHISGLLTVCEARTELKLKKHVEADFLMHLAIVRSPSLQPRLLLDYFQSPWRLDLIGWSLSDRQEVPDALCLHSQVGVQGDEGGAYQTLLHVTLHTHYTGDKCC